MNRVRPPFQAEAALREIERREGIARRWEQARSEVARQAYAEAYRALVGVHPAQRSEFRTSLELLRGCDRSSVDDLIARYRRQLHVSGFSSADGAGS